MSWQGSRLFVTTFAPARVASVAAFASGAGTLFWLARQRFIPTRVGNTGAVAIHLPRRAPVAQDIVELVDAVEFVHKKFAPPA